MKHREFEIRSVSNDQKNTIFKLTKENEIANAKLKSLNRENAQFLKFED